MATRDVKPKRMYILILGSSGDGKSTLIQMLKMCSIYKHLCHATQTYKADAKVRFTTTEGDNFDQVDVTIGNDDNEDYSKIGHSVTQRVKCHTILTDDIEINLIDTPGFNDTRGLDQDRRNFESIIQWVLDQNIQLDYIWCIMTPNIPRGDIRFRTFLNSIRDIQAILYVKSMYIFTNTSTTMFSIGDTRPILESNGISLEKENTFCFESEPFLYYMIQNHNRKKQGRHLTVATISVDNAYKSWKHSNAEWERLLKILLLTNTR